MKPIGCSNSFLAKPPILPKPLQHRMPSLSPTPRDGVQNPSRDSPSPVTGDDRHGDVTLLQGSPRQKNAADRRVKVRSPRRPLLLLLPNGTDKRTRPSRTNDRCRDLDATLADQVQSLNIRRPSAVPTNVDFSILRETRDSRGGGGGGGGEVVAGGGRGGRGRRFVPSPSSSGRSSCVGLRGTFCL